MSVPFEVTSLNGRLDGGLELWRRWRRWGIWKFLLPENRAISELMTELALPNDLGPIYKETVMGRWPVEPWNTVTTFFFLILVIYWFLKIKKEWRTHKLILATVILTSVGFVGGFIYHSTRSHDVWLFMDWLPIVINTVLAALYFWRKLLNSWWRGSAATLVPVLASLPLYTYGRMGKNIPATLGYVILVVSVALPFLLFARRTKYKNVWMIHASFVSVTTALLLRTFDNYPIMDIFPMGTHFLWHTFGALTCHFLMMYVYTMMGGQKRQERPAELKRDVNLRPS